MSTIKKHDLIELEYTGKTKEENIIFDTTDKDIAKENDLHTHQDFGPVVVCVGEQQVLPGLDKNLEGKETGKEYDFDIKPEDAFGKKDAKLIQLVPTSKFKKQNIHPQPGLQLNLDGMIGTIKTVSGGRTLVDFNHPLAGRELSYDVKINKMVNDDKEKVKAYLKLTFGIKDCEVKIEEGNAKIEIKTELNEKVKEEINKKITELIQTIKKTEFVIKKEEKK